MTKPSQTPPSPLSGAHLLEGLLSKEPRKRAIELAFLSRLLQGAPVGAAASKEDKVGFAETREIEDEVGRAYAGFKNPFFTELGLALERLQGGDVGFGPFRGAKSVLQPEGVREKLPAHSYTVIQDMIRRGDLLDSATFAAKLGWTQQTLSKALGGIVSSSSNRQV